MRLAAENIHAALGGAREGPFFMPEEFAIHDAGSQGVLLATTDGGVTWSAAAAGSGVIVTAEGDAVGRDKVTHIHAAPGSIPRDRHRNRLLDRRSQRLVELVH